MIDYLDGLLEGPSGLTNAVSRLGPILGYDSFHLVGEGSISHLVIPSPISTLKKGSYDYSH